MTLLIGTLRFAEVGDGLSPAITTRKWVPRHHLTQSIASSSTSTSTVSLAAGDTNILNGLPATTPNGVAPPLEIDIQLEILTTIGSVTTTFLTTGVETAIATTTDPFGHAITFTDQSTFIHPVTATSVIVTTISTTIAKHKSKGSGVIIGGTIGAAVAVILGLAAFCVFMRMRRKRRGFVNPTPNFEVSDATELQQSQAPRPTGASNSFLPHPFLGLTPTPQDLSAVKQREKEKIRISISQSQHNQEDGGSTEDPFKDLEFTSGDPSDQGVQDARNALDRIQQLTDQLETELQQLNNLARSGQLSEVEHNRLEEIRHTAGLTVPFDQRHGHISLASRETSYSTVPPSYHSE